MRFGTSISHSFQETFDMAKSVGESLTEPTILFLEGNLGAGKTVFAKGLICGLGQADPDDVPSPSFTLINEYDLRLKAYHIDLYRLDTESEIATLGLDDLFDREAVVLIEWGERFPKLMPGNRWEIRIAAGKEDERNFEVQEIVGGAGRNRTDE